MLIDWLMKDNKEECSQVKTNAENRTDWHQCTEPFHLVEQLKKEYQVLVKSMKSLS